MTLVKETLFGLCQSGAVPVPLSACELGVYIVVGEDGDAVDGTVVALNVSVVAPDRDAADPIGQEAADGGFVPLRSEVATPVENVVGVVTVCLIEQLGI